MSLKSILAAAALSAFCALPAMADTAVNDAMKALADGPVREWVADRLVVTAVQSQNLRNSNLTEQQILELDQTWRDQTITGGAMIDEVLANTLSKHLRQFQAQGKGRYTEIFVTDSNGLNVGQSDVTSDYWQGDEDKWQVPVATGRPHVSDIEFDESTQTYQSQLSVPIHDGDRIIGVITVGVNAEMLAQLN